jgi:hypothetical protein
MSVNVPLPVRSTAVTARSVGTAVHYSICTLVNDAAQYGEMVKSFFVGGFTEPECEFLHVDNTGENRIDAYGGLNLLLRAARGAYVILCHQDVRLLADGRERLDAVIADLDSRDPAWGLFGNSGGLPGGGLALRISDPRGDDQSAGGPFPVQVISLDENFIVARAAANLSVSGDLAGFHLYGVDLVLIAERLGYHAYVVDFLLQHLGSGTMDPSFHELRVALMAKHARTSRWQWMETTCVSFPLTTSSLMLRLMRPPHGAPLVWRYLTFRRWIAGLTDGSAKKPRS